jgi:hypothetical protein
VASLDLAGGWLRSDAVGKSGAFTAGSPVGSFSGEDGDDWYCGTPPPYFWHFHGPVPGPDPVWDPIGPGNGGFGGFFAVT